MIKTKILSGALQGAEIRPDALHDLERMVSDVVLAMVKEVHADRKEHGSRVINEADIERATLRLFGQELGVALVQHALDVRHRG